MIFSFLPYNKNSSQFFWVNWIIIIFLISSIFILTIDAGASLHSDEFLNLDLGKNILNPNTTWSIAWIVELQQPAFLFSYLGVVIQELIYENIGEFGPRIFALVGAIAAATSLVGYLIARGTLRKTAILLGLVFFLDPLIVQAFTIGRIDGWAMFFCLSCCWVLRKINTSHRLRSNLKNQLLLSGSLASLAIFTWPSAIFLFPLIILELFRLTSQSWKDHKKINLIIRILAIFLIGALIITILLLIPIFGRIVNQIGLIKGTININSQAGSSGIYNVWENLIELARVLKFSPFIVLLSSIAIFKLKQKILLFAFITVLITMIFTVVYINRVQYLIPYFIIAISEMFHLGDSRSGNNVLKKAGIGILLFWSISLSLGARTFLALDSQNERDRILVYQAALSMIGKGDYKVYIPWEFYYAGRSMNWEMYKVYEVFNSPMNSETLKKVLPCVDNFIVKENSKKFEQEIIEEGFVDKGVFNLYENPPEPFNGVTNNEVRIRNLYFIFHKPYGPYRLFVRD